MEELAQSFGCVQSHAEHRGSWQDQEILNKYRNIAWNIALTWDGKKPVQGWYDKRYETGHYDAVVDNNRVGCSAVEGGPNGYCIFCIYANGASPRYTSIRTQTCDKWANWAGSRTTEGEECLTDLAWDRED